MRWTVVIPVKSLPAAKSRLAPLSPDAESHAALVRALRRDTVGAARAAEGVARVLLVLDAAPGADADANADELPPGTHHIVQRQDGLNGALRDGAEHARACWPADGVALLVGDLPALQPAELSDALATAADGGDVCFVADAEGIGTTMLTGRPGVVPDPRFGAGSAARHHEIATALPAGPGLRRDIDTAEDLRSAAAELVLGPATAEELATRTTTWGPAPAVHLGLG